MMNVRSVAALQLICYCSVLLIICQFPCEVGGVPSDNDVMAYAYDMDQFDDVITTYMRERRIPGASVAVSKGGQFLVRKGYGRASQHRLMTPWALLRIGSVSKVVTAVGIMRLYEEKRLGLQETVFGETGVLPNFGSSFQDHRILRITVRDLLQHTSGWDHRITGDPLFQRSLMVSTRSNVSVRAFDKSDAVRYMLNQSLQHSPGTHYSYSNVGYTILGLIIEKLTGHSYETYLKDVLRRKGIYRMKLGKSEKEDVDISEVEYFSRYPNDRVQSVFNDSQLVEPPYGAFNLSLMDSSLGWIASASDLVRLFEALSDETGPASAADSSLQSAEPQRQRLTDRKLLAGHTVKEMLAKPRYTNASVWYSLGLVVQDGGKSFWHSGTLEGSTSVAAHDASGFTWSALLNSKLEPNDLGDFLRHTIRTVFISKQSSINGLTDAEMENDAGSHTSPKNRDVSEVLNFIDSRSEDGQNVVRLVIPDYRFAEIITAVSSKEFRLVWIDAFNEYGYTYFNVVWTLNTGGVRWMAYHDLTPSRYRKRFKARVTQGYRLAHVETYVSRKRMRYAAIFVKDVWPVWTAYDGYTPHRHKSEFYRLIKDGYRLVVQSVTEYKGQLYVTALYDKIYLGDSRVRLGLSLDEFSEELERHLASGRILSYVQAYESRGLVRFSAIWAPKTTRYWAVSQTMTKYTLYNKLLEYAAINVPLSCVTAYHIDDVLHFAALWRR